MGNPSRLKLTGFFFSLSVFPPPHPQLWVSFDPGSLPHSIALCALASADAVSPETNELFSHQLPESGQSRTVPFGSGVRSVRDTAAATTRHLPFP